MTNASSPKLVLASGSPRRREFLSQLQLTFTVDPADVDESVVDGEAPDAYVLRLAKEKARRVSGRHADAVVLAADTTVAFANQILGKPDNADDAVRMLASLGGREHTVFTAVAVARNGVDAGEALVRTEVRMRRASDAELRWYASTGEPLDKAGAYGMQGIGSFLIESIGGSPTSVIGLPLTETVALLTKEGVSFPWSAGR